MQKEIDKQYRARMLLHHLQIHRQVNQSERNLQQTGGYNLRHEKIKAGAFNKQHQKQYEKGTPPGKAQGSVPKGIIGKNLVGNRGNS